MPTLTSVSFLIPKTWEDFENIWCDLLREEWNDPNITRNGRQGQKQHGVDIYGRREGGPGYIGVRCKLHQLGRKLTRKEFKECIEDAETFKPPLEELLIVTTGQKDAKL